MLDAVTEDPTIVRIPVVGTLINAYKATKAISNRILLRKLIRFLTELKDVPEKTRITQLGRLETDSKYAGAVGDSLFLLLERQNDLAKPGLLARTFRAVLLARITYEEFLRIGHALDRLDLTRLPVLQDFYGPSPSKIDDSAMEHLFACGLVSLDFSRVGQFGGGKPEYRRNTVGSQFFQHALNDTKETS